MNVKNCLSVGITCALRWGVPSIGITLLGGLTLYEITLQVREMCRWAVLIRSHESEESHLVAL